MNKIPTPEENPNGLHSKYKIEHTDGSPIDPEAIYFVLRIDKKQKNLIHQIACREAAYKYCEEVKSLAISSNTCYKVADELNQLLVNI